MRVPAAGPSACHRTAYCHFTPPGPSHQLWPRLSAWGRPRRLCPSLPCTACPYNLRLLAGCTSPWALGGLSARSGRAVALGLLCPRSPASWSPHRSAACWEQRMRGSARAWFPQVTRSRATPGSHSVWRVWTTCVYGSDGHLASPAMSAVMTPVYPSAQPHLSRNRFREYLSDSVN